MTKPVRIEYGLPMADYRAHEAVSKSELDVAAECWAKYAAFKSGLIERKETDAMKYGTQLHALILDGVADYHVQPVNYPSSGMMCPECKGVTDSKTCSKCNAVRIRVETTKPWNGGATFCDEWELAHADKPILTLAESEELHRTSAHLLKHPHAAPRFVGAKSEVSLFGVHEETGIAIKGRPDLMSHEMSDLKSIIEASNRGLSRAIALRRYHVAAAMYLMLAQQNKLNINDYYYIAIERGAVPLINVRLLTQKAIELGRATLDKQLRELKHCRESGFWPDYSGAGEKPGEIDLPPYAYTDTTGMEKIEMD